MQSPVVDAFHALLRADPAAPVAWTAAGVRTRADLEALADRADQALAGQPSGARVAISVRSGLCFLAATLAVWRRGSCAVLLDAADPQAPRLDLARQCRAGAVLVDEGGFRCTELSDGLPADGLAAVKLTSGSTDRPRGVGASAGELVADCDALQRSMGIAASDRILAAVPMSFSYGVGSLLLPALWRGRVLVLPDEQHPLGLLQALRRGEPTVLPAVPALLRGLLAGPIDLPACLRLVVSAGATLPPSVASAFRARFGRPVHAFYGATEAGGICYDRRGDAAERGTVGSPVEGVQVRLDGDGGVRVQSPAVGRALVDDPALADGVFSAPDLGEWRGDELALLGRRSDVFDVGGHKVHPLEVERIVAELEGVRDVAVVPWHDGAGRPICAVLVVAADLDEAAVRRHCLQRLPMAKVPRRIVFLSGLPRDGRGKLQRSDVARALDAVAPGGADGRLP